MHLVRQTFDLTVVLVPGLVDRRQLLLQFLEALVASGQFLGELLDLSFGAVVRVARRCELALDVLDPGVLLVDGCDELDDPVVRGGMCFAQLRGFARRLADLLVALLELIGELVDLSLTFVECALGL